jgi:formate dehydrogenase major subunit
MVHSPSTTRPIESPVKNLLHPQQQNNPVSKKFQVQSDDKYGTVAEGYNIICTTYRLTEHYHYWTKNNPMNVQLQPEPFVEIPAELADDMGYAWRRESEGQQRTRILCCQGHGHTPHSSRC